MLPCLLLLFSGAMKLVRPPAVLQGFGHLGLPEGLARPLGGVEVACALLYLFPRTAVLGAILVTGYMGGAILAHLRMGEPILMQVFLGVMVWGGLYLRDPRLGELLPFRR